MPRASQSPESKILSYFQSAPLGQATLVLGLATAAVKARGPKVVVKHRRKKATLPAPVMVAPAPKAAKPAVSHKKKGKPGPKPRHTVPAAAEVEDFAGAGV